MSIGTSVQMKMKCSYRNENIECKLRVCIWYTYFLTDPHRMKWFVLSLYLQDKPYHMISAKHAWVNIRVIGCNAQPR
jgi:hypothetical protein